MCIRDSASGLSQLESSLENMGASTASEIEESANAMSGQLNDSAETMNSQADAIESWISDSAEASVDASSVDAGVAAVSSCLLYTSVIAFRHLCISGSQYCKFHLYVPPDFLWMLTRGRQQICPIYNSIC